MLSFKSSVLCSFLFVIFLLAHLSSANIELPLDAKIPTKTTADIEEYPKIDSEIFSSPKEFVNIIVESDEYTPPAPPGSRLLSAPLKIRGGKVYWIYP